MDSLFDSPLDLHSIRYKTSLISRDELNKEIDRLAIYLSTHHHDKFNQNYYLHFENSIGAVIAYFGILKTGANVIILNPQIKTLEFQEYHSICNGANIINPPEFPFQQEWGNFITTVLNPGNNNFIPPNQWTIVFTNGIDGNLGAALLSSTNLTENSIAYSASNKMDESYTSYSLLPFYHLYGLQVGLITPSLTGGKLILSPAQELLNLKHISKNAAETSKIILYSIPAFYHLLLEQNASFPFSNIRHFISGGYALTENIALSFLNLTQRYIQQGYGLTEAGPIVSWNFNPNDGNYLSVGQIIGDSICSINKAGESVEEGEILIKGKNIFSGYWNNEKKTSARLKNNWLQTLDTGYLKNGDLYITRPPKHVYNKLGHNLYIKEIQRYMQSHPCILNAEIYPVSKNAGGDILEAEISLKKGKKLEKIDLKKWLANRISNYKIPQRLIIR